MAYAAILSLSRVLQDSLTIYDQYLLPLEKVKLASLQTKVNAILTFLEEEEDDHFHNDLQTQIIDSAYQVEDIIESKISSMYTATESSTLLNSTLSSNSEPGCMDLDDRVLQIDSILDELMKTKNTVAENIPPPDRSYLSSSSSFALNNTYTMVGFDDDFDFIKGRIRQTTSSDFEIIPIVGMGGIGKTTLAKRLYEDSIRSHYFDRHAWVAVSQDYSFRKVVLELLQSEYTNLNELRGKTDAELRELAYKVLYCRRYLIVVDDVWSTKVCDDLNLAFPKNKNGSRVLLTTRLLDVATYVTTSSRPPHQMPFLNEDHSWRLLEEIVFEKGSCPLHLEQIGRRISENCRGLPLTLTVVAGLLKGNIRKEYWESISQNINSAEPTIALQCLRVVSLSYDHLPRCLKLCFLYVMAFPQDHEINTDQLIRLWMAEGFVRPNGSKCLEEVAEEYLDDLLRRSLLLVSKKRYNGRIKTVKIHDVLRDVGTVKAQEECFHYRGPLGTVTEKQRRLSIHTVKSVNLLRDVNVPMTRSLMILWSGEQYSCERIPVHKFRLLRILDALTLPHLVKPANFVHLRYLAVRPDQCLFSKWMFKLQNLQTFVVYKPPNRIFGPNKGGRKYEPLAIWNMPALRHIILPERSSLNPLPQAEIIEETNLQTLTIATNLEITRQAAKMLGNVRKLGLLYSLQCQRDWEEPQLSNLVCLEKLEELKIIMSDWTPEVLRRPDIAFPQSLRKLSLNNVLLPSWDDISMILGSLPNLEVLKLRGSVVEYPQSVWNPVEGQFLILKYLELTDVPLHIWGVESIHFPSLETLSLKRHYRLNEIPSDIGEINSLKLIELVGCHPELVASAKQIQADQRELGNHDLQIVVKRFS